MAELLPVSDPGTISSCEQEYLELSRNGGAKAVDACFRWAGESAPLPHPPPLPPLTRLSCLLALLPLCLLPPPPYIVCLPGVQSLLPTQSDPLECF